MYILEGFGTVFPYIFASDAAAYLTFLERAFGAEVVGRTEAPDGTVANARVRIGTTAFMVSEAGGRVQAQQRRFLHLRRGCRPDPPRGTRVRRRRHPRAAGHGLRGPTGGRDRSVGEHLVDIDAGGA
jgi:hypothetical protein